MKKRKLGIILTVSFICFGCGAESKSANIDSATAAPVAGLQGGPTTIPKGTRTFETDALVYNGAGVWSAEVPAIQQILSSHGASYKTVTSAQLNAMSLDELAKFGAIVWPGGYGNQMTESLTSASILKIRQAVQDRGVSWVGFCAGAFVAVNPTPMPGEDPDYGLSIVNGPMLEYYYLEEEFVRQGRESQDWAMTLESFADGSKRDILWYGGPVTPNISGHVVAKYPNGDAAITQLWSGNGFVMLSAVHPTVSSSVSSSFGLNDSDGHDQETAWKLISAAIHQNELPVF